MKKLALLPICLFFSISLFSQASFDIDKKPINNQLLNLLCDHELKWFRNEIYARHGYVFSNKEYQSYFEAMDWYSPVSNNNQVKLSKTEQDNITILKKEEDKRVLRNNAIKKYFKDLKDGKIDYKTITKDDSSPWPNDLFPPIIFNKIDIDEMTFCSYKGLYQITVDDGFSVTSYFLDINGNDIKFGYNSQGGSSIFPEGRGEYEDECNDHIRVGEHSLWMEFKIDDSNNIRFVQINGAG